MYVIFFSSDSLNYKQPVLQCTVGHCYFINWELPILNSLLRLDIRSLKNKFISGWKDTRYTHRFLLCTMSLDILSQRLQCDSATPWPQRKVGLEEKASEFSPNLGFIFKAKPENQVSSFPTLTVTDPKAENLYHLSPHHQQPLVVTSLGRWRITSLPSNRYSNTKKALLST